MKKGACENGTRSKKIVKNELNASEKKKERLYIYSVGEKKNVVNLIKLNTLFQLVDSIRMVSLVVLIVSPVERNQLVNDLR